MTKTEVEVRVFNGDYEELTLFLKRLHPEREYEVHALRIQDEENQTRRWLAVTSEGIRATLNVSCRPDGRFFMTLEHTPPMEPLLRELTQGAEQDLRASGVGYLYTLSRTGHPWLEASGFQVSRREQQFELCLENIPAKTLNFLERSYKRLTKYGFEIASLAERQQEPQRDYKLWRLDNELRQAVPGTTGWNSSFEQFYKDTLATRAFDPDTYLVASKDNDYLGLLRIWLNPSGPRLGLIAVKAAYYRTGLALALVHHAVKTCIAKGLNCVTAESDSTNESVLALHRTLNSKGTGETLEWVKKLPKTNNDQS
jgi:GNAT superfamily N-acetyltransferase